MKGRELQNLGIPAGEAVKLAQKLTGHAADAGLNRDEIRDILQALLEDPAAHRDHDHFGELAQMLSAPEGQFFYERSEPAPWKQWGTDLEEGALQQMRNSCRLPVAVAGALMPDAHQGYGLPIGGVLATEESVIPYAVGVDIACRMKLTIFDLPGSVIETEQERLSKILERETRFGIGATHRKPQEHDVMDMDWNVTKVTKDMKAKAHSQLGTSGSGNHFVEFGTMTFTEEQLGVPAGEYLAVLSHSGSRGPGARVADHYSKLAMHLHPELPKELRHLAWLDMNKAEGQEYWAAMQLMGEYAAANHAVIHRLIARAVQVPVLSQVENHHNFCIAEDSLVPTPLGPKKIQDIQKGDTIYTFDESEGIIPTQVLAQWSSGEKDIVQIQTNNRRLRCSGEHPVLVFRSDSATLRVEEPFGTSTPFVWVKAEDLREGDLLACAEGSYQGSSSERLPPSIVKSLPSGLSVQMLRRSSKLPPAKIYDLTVAHPSHSFVCEGIVVHNCWVEKHGGKEVYVHRKGATPAGVGVLGIIPGSMASPGYLVRGRGDEASLHSASHGAGRVMSRTKAFQNLKWADAKSIFEKKKVTVLSAGIDELPFVYKDIQEVMNAQSDLVDILGRFDPRIVKMAPAGEKPED